MLLTVNENDSRPIYLQIISQIREQVSNGMLQPGDELPSVRETADSLGINMHTVRSAYLKLSEQGIITLRLGRRAKIARRHLPVRNADLAADIELRLKELFADATLAGISKDDLRKLVNQKLAQLKRE
ncbi:MAG: GntR family transcriptional regulator [Dehalococcoidales bacterium]|nr:GntR family transcriptional regulator [Dehalococcoidales bacterium]